MKKKILFVISTLESGGAEKSLINLLNTIDYQSYAIDLLVFKKRGIFFNTLPSQVKLIEISNNNFPILGTKTEKLSWLIKRKKIKLILSLLKIKKIIRSYKKLNSKQIEQIMWQNIYKYALLKHDIEYDIAIGFLQGTPNYFVIDKVNAKKKILWMHTDYLSSGLDVNLDRYYFREANNIVTVSQACFKSFVSAFPEFQNKTNVIHNISSIEVIKVQSKQDPCDSFASFDGIKILTIARPCYSKGIDIALETTKLLKDLGYNFKWYFVGRYSQKEYESIMRVASEKDIINNFILLGEQENPYKYLSRSTIYVHPSRLEGKSMAIDEAMLLGKPIVVTNFSTAYQQINNGINGLIVEQNANSVLNGIRKLLDDNNLRDSFIFCLLNNTKDNTSEIRKLYKMMNET